MMLSILLATYNGAKRLPILLNSLLIQSYRDWIIYIHDDGSTDGTARICEDFQKRDSRIIILHDDVKHRGAKNSFMWLLEHVEADYYMFCDQDDLWLPFKVQQSVELMKEQELKGQNIPVCVHTDLAVTDKYYNVMAQSLWKRSKIEPGFLEKKDYLQVFNCVTGCTMIFNQKAKEVSLPFNKIAPMHDFWVAYSTLSAGGILTHLNRSTILYCQHDTNEVGAIHVDKWYVLNKIRTLKLVFEHNWHNYQMMHAISGISMLRFFSCKLRYEIHRFL